MYLPKSFEETDIETLHQFITSNNFATLITQHENIPFASHIPLYLKAEAGSYGSLIGHVARANPQWRDFEDGREVLIVFHGAHTYVSPSWYEAMPSVPTWNYVAVHAYAVPRVMQDQTELYQMLHDLVDFHEAGFEQAWDMEELSEDYMHKMMQAIVGFELKITRLEGKYKLSQNRSHSDQVRVVAALSASPSPVEQAVAELMSGNLRKES